MERFDQGIELLYISIVLKGQTKRWTIHGILHKATCVKDTNDKFCMHWLKTTNVTSAETCLAPDSSITSASFQIEINKSNNSYFITHRFKGDDTGVSCWLFAADDQLLFDDLLL